MNYQIVRILEPEELAQILPRLAAGKFVDGKLTASGPAREVKNNLQVERSGPELTELDQILLAAVRRNPLFQAFSFAKRILLPVFNRYEVGMEYGPHVDSAVMGKGAEQIRTDLSMTIFLSDPASYEGGELALETPLGEDEIKLDAGEAVVYPSTTVHRVTPVTRGVRLAAITWIQSSVPDERLRGILFDLRNAVAKADSAGDPELRTLLHKSYNNLLRLALDL
jgi:PKHD-type hydroxylase